VRHQVTRLREADVHVEVLAFRGKANPLRYLEAARRLRRVYRSQSFDVIHAHHGQSALITLGGHTSALVATFHGSDLQGLSGTGRRFSYVGYLLPRLSRIIARLADEVIVVSHHMARYLSRPDYHVIPAGIDMDLFSPMPKRDARRRCGLPLDRRLVLFVGDPLNPIKRYELARDSVALLQDTTDVELIVCCGVPQNQMPLYMSACDVLLVTSTHEGSPNAVKEALACNLPVVSTAVGDVPERLAGIEGCLVVDDSLPEAIADGVASVLESRPEIDGRSSVRSLDERVLAQQVIDVYRQAIARRRGK